MQTDPKVASGMPKMVEDPFGMFPRATNSEKWKIKFLLKIVTFVTKNSEAKNWISKWGSPGGKRTSPMRQALQKMVADAEETRNGAGGEDF